jgi:hypothetical protein
MGIDGLSGYLRSRVSHAYTKIPISSLARAFAIQRPSRDLFDNNIGIAVDLSWLGYKAIGGATVKSMKLLEVDPVMQLWHWENHILGILRGLLEFGITPLLVLDGKPPVEKMATQEKRREQGNKKKQQFNKLLQEWNETPPQRRTQLQLELAQTALLRSVHPPYEFRQHLRSLLIEWGFPVWQSTGEADPLCAALAIDGIVSAVMTNDHDLLAYGVDFIITELYLLQGDVEVLNRRVVLEALNLTHAQFQVWCFYCGTDYNDGIPGIGPVRGLELARSRVPVTIGDVSVEDLRKMFAPYPHRSLLAEKTIYQIDPVRVLKGYTEWTQNANGEQKNVKWESFQQKLASWRHPPISVISRPPM